jgi:two-component system LytT family sensor kinase
VTASNAADVLNLVGFVTGTALYAMLLALVVRGAARPAEAPARRDWLPLATALLGLSWNLGELAAYALPRLGLAADSVGLSALSFPALGLLAAVVVHSVVRDLRYSRAAIALAYALAVSAGVLHIRTVISGDPATSTLAFQLLTISFSVLIVPLAFITRAQPNGRRALWVLALVLFAVSATHLGSFHSSTDSWWMQLLGHHAAIPLAFAILYQNYRFALGDLFLKQALTLLAIVTVTLAGYSAASAVPEGPASVGLLLALWVATALVAPWLRRAVVRFVDAVLLGRADYGALRAGIGCAIDDQPTLAGVMDTICERLAGTFSARQVWWTTDERTLPGGPESPMQAVAPMRPGAPPPSRTVTVATTDRPHLFIHVGELTGGRRLLSDDEALLETVAVMAARRIDAIRLTLERYETQLREEEMQKLAAEAELKALRAQINPHFLFNALTTIGYLIDSAPSRALDTLLRLTRLLRGVLRPEGEFTTLGREIDLVEHYLDIERERFEERLRVRVDVPAWLRGVAIPSLVVQPLVENAIKHGVAPSASGGDVEVLADRVDATEGSPRLRVIVRNTGAPLSAGHRPGGDHVGLENVARRLRGHYGSMAGVTLSTDDRGSTVATLELPFAEAGHLEEFDAQAVAGRPGRR